MSIAICLRVEAGIVLGVDSADCQREVAVTPECQDQVQGYKFERVYRSARKIHQVQDGAPIGAVLCGSLFIGPNRVSSLMDQFRASSHSLAVKDVAEELADSLYTKQFMRHHGPTDLHYNLKIYLAGYSPRILESERYFIEIAHGQLYVTDVTNELPLLWGCQADAANRLLNGQIPDQWLPLSASVHLVETLVNAQIAYAELAPGTPTVIGPAHVAVITRTNGFQWHTAGPVRPRRDLMRPPTHWFDRLARRTSTDRSRGTNSAG